MKRKLKITLAVVMAVISLCTLVAFAANWYTSCPRCGNTSGSYVELDSDKYHETHYNCGAVYYQSHSWSGKTCWKCGY